MHKIDCLIMAGGKSSRFNFSKISLDIREKALISIDNRKLIDLVINPIINSKWIKNIYIAVSPNTPLTKSYLIDNYMEKIILIDTPGENFHKDLQFVIKNRRIKHIIILTSDLPILSIDIIEKIIEYYFEKKKPALSVMMELKIASKYVDFIDIAFFKKNPEKIHIDENRRKLLPIGINIINGSYIDQNFIEQVDYITENASLLYNINTVEDYYRLKKYIRELKYTA